MKSYKDSKEDGLITTEKVNTNSIQVTRKRFDQYTGEETDPVSALYSKAELEVTKEDLTKELNDINEMLKEFNK